MDADCERRGPAPSASALGRPFGELRVGDRAVTRGRTITETDLVLFGTLTGDMHPQHSDAAWAETTPFGQRIAHGMLLLSYAIGLSDLDPRWVVAMRRIERVVFKRPGLLGDTIHVEGTISSLQPVDAQRGLVGLDLKIRSQADVLALASLGVVWRRALGEG